MLTSASIYKYASNQHKSYISDLLQKQIDTWVKITIDFIAQSWNIFF